MNWNVYKIFKNGKRAKAPMTSFEYDNESNAAAYFEAEIKKNFSEKIRDLNFSILRSDGPQEREEEETNKIEEEARKKEALILGRLLKKTAVTSKYRVIGGLIFAKATNWNWQWCALEYGTNQFIAGLSPAFDSHVDAQEWMNEQVQNLEFGGN